jgi:hypothetical protein
MSKVSTIGDICGTHRKSLIAVLSLAHQDRQI